MKCIKREGNCFSFGASLKRRRQQTIAAINCVTARLYEIYESLKFMNFLLYEANNLRLKGIQSNDRKNVTELSNFPLGKCSSLKMVNSEKDLNARNAIILPSRCLPVAWGKFQTLFYVRSCEQCQFETGNYSRGLRNELFVAIYSTQTSNYFLPLPQSHSPSNAVCIE